MADGLHVPYGVASAFVEHEFQPTGQVTVLAGLRVDDYTTTGHLGDPDGRPALRSRQGTTSSCSTVGPSARPNLNESQTRGV